tara:strand:- start:1995 stop:2123 length:129 start_codon:yes stop_codon:yes gene_type:complete
MRQKYDAKKPFAVARARSARRESTDGDGDLTSQGPAMAASAT